MERLTVRVAVYIMLIKEGTILLSRPFNTGWQDGKYTLPSGHLEPNETIIEALLRETKEETGIILTEEDVKFAHTMHRKSTYIDFYFVAKNWVGEPKNMALDIPEAHGARSILSVPGLSLALEPPTNESNRNDRAASDECSLADRRDADGARVPSTFQPSQHLGRRQ